MNYAKELPLDKKASTYPALPAVVSNQSQGGVPIASSVISLNDKTTVVDFVVLGGQSANAGIIGKWGPSSVTSSNYDFMVLSGEHRPFVVPVSVMGTTSIAGANVANGLYATVAVKTMTGQSASVFTAEY